MSRRNRWWLSKSPWLATIVVLSLSWSAVGQDANQKAVEEKLAASAEFLAKNNLTRAIEAAIQAETMAKRNFAETDAVTARAVIAVADLRVIEALVANHPDSAMEWATYGNSVAVRDLPAGDPIRVKTFQRIAFLHQRKNDERGALEWYLKTADDAKASPERNVAVRIEALLIAARLQGFPVGDETLSAALQEAEARLPTGDPMLIAAQQFAERFFWEPMLQQAIRKLDAGGDYAAVEGELRTQLEGIAGKEGGSPIARLGMLWLARLQWLRQRIADADATLAALKPALEASKAADFLKARVWTQQGLLEARTLNYESARKLFEQALAANIAAKSPLEAAAYNNLGELMLEQGNYKTAEDYLKKAIQLCEKSKEPDSETFAHSLINLAVVLRAQGDLDGSIARLEKARELAPKHDPMAAQAISINVGLYHYDRKQFDKAAEQFKMALAEAEAKLSGSRQQLAGDSFFTAQALLEMGQNAEAEQRFRRSLDELRGKFDDHPFTPLVQAYLARALVERGANEEAATALRSVIAVLEQFIARSLRSNISERDRLALIQTMRFNSYLSRKPGVLDTYLSLANEVGISADEQYSRVLFSKGAVGRFSPPQFVDAKTSPEVSALIAKRQELLGELRSRIFDTTTLLPEERKRRLADVEGKLNAVELELRVLATGQAGAGDAAIPDDVRSVLKPGETLLDVVEIRTESRPEPGKGFVGAHRYIGFVIQPGQPTRRIDFGDAAEINKTVKEFHGALSRGSKKFAEPGDKLAKLIRQPLEEIVAQSRTLIIVGDGWFHRLPLGALPGKEAGTYWLEELAFAFVPTAQSLVERRRRPPSTSDGLLLLGGLDYGSLNEDLRKSLNRSSRGNTPVTVEWEYLPATKDEAQTVRQMFAEQYPNKPIDLLTGEAGTEETVKAALAKRRYVHLATHGFFQADLSADDAFDLYGVAAEFDSMLILSNVNLTKSSEAIDQLLTANEVRGLDLRGVKLMVLSACDTGLGHISAGQGVIGLLGAFDRAGVGALTSALWPVEDEATAALMTAFYGYLWSEAKPVGPAEALRLAQRDLIRGVVKSSAGRPFTHPLQWAAFVLSGDPE